MTLRDYANKISKINAEKIFFDISSKLLDEFVQLNKDQLMEGISNSGNDVRPFYSEDNYFKSLNASMAYTNWKQKITPNPKRNPDAPNLFINGKFHSGFFAQISGKDFIFGSNDSNASKIESKFKGIYGLSPDNKEIEKNKMLNLCWDEIIKLLN